jgi:hypothetical protein
MDVQRLIGEVARRHNVLVDPGDPLFAAVTLNELLLAEHLEKVQVALLRSEAAIEAAAREHTDQARQVAERLLTQAAAQVSDQMRAASTTLRQQLEKTIESSVRSARSAAWESSQNRRATFWAAALATACACVSAAATLYAWLKG